MDQQELINDYLNGKLSKKDQKLFETLIDENPEYKSQFELQKKRQASNRPELKDSFNSSKITADPLQISNSTSLKSWLFSGAIALAVVLFGYFLWTMLGMSPGEKIYAKYYEPLSSQAVKSAAPSNSSGLIAEALKAYDQGDFKKAASLFGELQIRPDSDYILLYHGICLLELGRPEKAIPLFSLLRDDASSELKEVVSWYEALGYFKLNMLEKGKIPLKITAAGPNIFQAEADKILKSLK